MSRGVIPFKPQVSKHHSGRMEAAAWLLAAVYYFYQYVLRSAPSVMMPELSNALNISPLGVAFIVGIFYYGYSPFGLVAGAAMDRVGPRRLLPGAAAVVGIGAFLFATGNRELASAGRFLQGAGGVFSLVGAIYIAGRSFAPSHAATLIGATQMAGMAGGAAGQFVVGPLIGRGLDWNVFWTAMGVVGLVIGALLFVLLPQDERIDSSDGWLKSAASAFKTVFTNPQSIWCGLIAALLFLPTTIFDTIWGGLYLQEGHGLDYGSAVMRSATVPLGWIIGCPLLGLMSDRIGRRKPVIIGAGVVLFVSLAWILYGVPGVVSPYVVGLVVGIASGAAMLPYTIIKEVNPPQIGGTATGVVTFLNFTFIAVLGPVFGWMLQNISDGAGPLKLQHYQSTFGPLLYGVMVAMLLTLLLRETGPALRAALPKVERQRLKSSPQ